VSDSLHKGSNVSSIESPAEDEERMRPCQCSVSVLCFLHGFDTVGWWQEEHPTNENLRHLSPKVLFQNRQRKKTEWEPKWLNQIHLKNGS